MYAGLHLSSHNPGVLQLRQLELHAVKLKHESLLIIIKGIKYNSFYTSIILLNIPRHGPSGTLESLVYPSSQRSHRFESSSWHKQLDLQATIEYTLTAFRLKKLIYP